MRAAKALNGVCRSACNMFNEHNFKTFCVLPVLISKNFNLKGGQAKVDMQFFSAFDKFFS